MLTWALTLIAVILAFIVGAALVHINHQGEHNKKLEAVEKLAGQLVKLRNEERIRQAAARVKGRRDLN